MPTDVEDVIRRVRDRKLTYLSERCLADLARAVSDADDQQRPGLIIEAGTALGGSAIVMAWAKNTGRRMRVYDAFSTIPPPSELDGDDVHRRYAKIASGNASGIGGETYYGYREDLLGEVTDSFKAFGIAPDEANVELIKGYFDETLHVDEPVALAHLDGDWYESTMTCLQRIEPHLVPGGRLVIDDYFKWSGCHRAIDEYFDGRPGYEFERHGRLHIVKTSRRGGWLRRRRQDYAAVTRRDLSLIARLRRLAGRRIPVATRAQVRAIRRSRTAARRRVAELTAERDRLKAALASRPDSGEFAQRLAIGQSLDHAAVATVRDMIKAGDLDEATAFAYALADQPGTAEAGHLAAAVIATARKLPDLAYNEFQHAAPDAWLQHATAEYLDAVYRCAPGKLTEALHGVLESPHSHQDAAALFEVIKYSYVLREFGIAKRAYDLLRQVTSPGQFELDVEMEWLRPWLDISDADDPLPASDDVRFALLDYRQPGRAKTSQNIGDYIQTLSSLGHIARHQNLRFHGDAELVDFVSAMQQRVRRDRRLDTAARDVTLSVVSRDASTYQAIPEATWALVFGWFMHPVFGLRHDFPMHPSLRPIFVSFHCNKRELLTPEAVGYLRRYGPVGCRDWTTVDLLLSLDVPAYFSGCLTTTIDTLFSEEDPQVRPEPATVYVDMRRDVVPSGAATAKHSYRKVKQRSFVDNLSDGMAVLERYRQEFTDVVTSRLHCYLPARSLGLHVDFQPKNRTDIRFGGLIDIDEDAFDSIRATMLARIETVMSAIVDGHSVDEVYSRWQDACADDVAEARARHARLKALPRTQVDISTVVHAVPAQDDSADSYSPIDLVIVAGKGDETQLRATIGSVAQHASSHVRVWLVGRGWNPSLIDTVNEIDPRLDVRLVSCDELPPGIEPLLLPSLLPDLRRVIIVPAGAVLLADVGELAGLELGGYSIAAATASGTTARSGFGVIYRAAKRLHPEAATAHELYLRAQTRHRFDFDAFETDVLVLDLERLRKDDFVATFLPYHERFGLRAGEIFNQYAGPDRAVLPNAWAHRPTKQWCDSPKLVHWTGVNKPWQDLYVPGRKLWHQALLQADRSGHGQRV